MGGGGEVLCTSVPDKLTICRIYEIRTKKMRGIKWSWYSNNVTTDRPKGSRDERQGCCKFVLLFGLFAAAAAPAPAPPLGDDDDDRAIFSDGGWNRKIDCGSSERLTSTAKKFQFAMDTLRSQRQNLLRWGQEETFIVV